MPEAMAVSRGAEVTLSCGSEGDPAPTVTWRRQGNLTSVPGQADGSLVVSNVQESDAGTYICTARNTWGVATGNASITVVGESKLLMNISQSMDVGRHCSWSVIYSWGWVAPMKIFET